MINDIYLVGRLGRDPEYKTIGQSGICTFAVATTSSKKDAQGNWIEETEWHEVKKWGEAGRRFAETSKKGDLVVIRGSYVTEEYTNKDGVEIKKKVVKADKLVKA